MASRHATVRDGPLAAGLCRRRTVLARRFNVGNRRRAICALARRRCRTIELADAGRRIVGIAIKPDTLAMRLSPPWTVRLSELAVGALAAMAVLVVVGILVRFRPRPNLFAPHGA
jgi:hypothetical protein